VSTVFTEIETCKTNKKYYESKLTELERRIKDINTRITKYQAEIEVKMIYLK